MITVENNGKELVATNYWRSEHAIRGYVYVSVNAGCLRIMIPKASNIDVNEMRSADIVLITRCLWATEKGLRDAVEILFEDHTASPYCLHLVVEQFDMVPAASDRDRPGDAPRWRVAVYTEQGKQFEIPARLRLTKKLPYMKEWNND